MRTEQQPQALFVTFSGIDGAGKSTQIDLLHRSLKDAGVRVLRLAFWNNGALFSRLRELASHHLFKGDKGIGTPDHPIKRRDKNIQAWPLTLARLALYSFDAARLKLLLPKLLRSGSEIVIFDRYIYDELANLPLDNRIIRGYARRVANWVCRPDIAFFLDADPACARDRKPEYELAFLQRNRRAYLLLSALVKEIKVVPAAAVPEVHAQVSRGIIELLPYKETLPESLPSTS